MTEKYLVRAVRTYIYLLLTTFLLCCSGESEKEKSETKNNDQEKFQFLVVADTHIIDEHYECCENGDLDTKSIYKTKDRLNQTISMVKGLPYEVLFGIHVGDVFHDYPFKKFDDFIKQSNQVLYSSEMMQKFGFPIYYAWGNHDYGVPEVPRETTKKLFEHYFKKPLYEAIDFRGWKFIVLNGQLGPTWDKDSKMYKTANASLGAEQLKWLDEQLSENKPSILFTHHALFLFKADENPAEPKLKDILTVLKRHKNVKTFISGHTHRWLNFETMYKDFPHYIMGATRYDANNFWIIEIDPKTNNYNILDKAKAKWSDVGSNPFDYKNKDKN